MMKKIEVMSAMSLIRLRSILSRSFLTEKELQEPYPDQNEQKQKRLECVEIRPSRFPMKGKIVR